MQETQDSPDPKPQEEPPPETPTPKKTEEPVGEFFKTAEELQAVIDSIEAGEEITGLQQRKLLNQLRITVNAHQKAKQKVHQLIEKYELS